MIPIFPVHVERRKEKLRTLPTLVLEKRRTASSFGMSIKVPLGGVETKEFMTKLISLIIMILALSFSLFANEEVIVEPTRKERIEKAFNTLRADNLHILDNFYHPELTFTDPVGSLTGLKAMKDYYRTMYENVQDIKFHFHHMVEEDNNIMVTWTMDLRADGLNGGEMVKVAGVSHVVFDERTNLVISHRDYFDMGEFVYETVPILGSIIRYIKKKLSH